jgi:hypothetical protein
MTFDIRHLTADAAYWLGQNDERRIRAIRSRRWVLYPREAGAGAAKPAP